MIKYSTYLRKNPLKPEEAPKAYAVAQVTEKVTLSKFAEHIAKHGSELSKGTIMAVLTNAVAELREMLLEGKKVELGDLGEFYVTINSKPAATLAEFTKDNITSVNAKWQPSDDFDDMLSDAEFEFTLTRKAEEDAKKAHKAQTTPSEGGTDTDQGSEGTDTPKEDTGTSEGSGSEGEDKGSGGDGSLV